MLLVCKLVCHLLKFIFCGKSTGAVSHISLSQNFILSQLSPAPPASHVLKCMFYLPKDWERAWDKQSWTTGLWNPPKSQTSAHPSTSFLPALAWSSHRGQCSLPFAMAPCTPTNPASTSTQVKLLILNLSALIRDHCWRVNVHVCGSEMTIDSKRVICMFALFGNPVICVMKWPLSLISLVCISLYSIWMLNCLNISFHKEVFLPLHINNCLSGRFFLLPSQSHKQFACL